MADDNSALITAGINAAGQIATNVATAGQNSKQRRWQENMYNLQRQHALEDRDWQADYNSPSAAMARLKAAGLNPNLVYGNGITQNAPTIRSSQVGSWNPTPPRFDPGSVMASYFDTQIRQAQTDNLKEQIKKTQSENDYIKAQTVLSLENSKGKAFDNLLNSEMRNNSIEMKDALLKKLRADIDMSVHGNRRQDQLNEMQINSMKDNLKTAAVQRLEAMSRTENNRQTNGKIQAEIAAIKQGTYNSVIDGELKMLEKERQERGASTSDPWYVKRLDAIAQKLGGKWKK